MAQTITLVVVGTVEDEAATLRRLAELTAFFGTPVAPVLNRDELLNRVVEALRACEVIVQCERFERLPTETGRRLPARPWASEDRPGAVFASDGVDSGALRLAAGLCGVEALRISQPARELLGAVPESNRTALVLFNPEATRSHDLVSTLKAMASEDVHVGLLYAIDPIEARFAILKSLLVGRLMSQGRYAVLSGIYAPSPSENAPGWFHNSESSEGRCLLERDQDVLLLNGHANAFDSSPGKDLILCSRQGRRTGPSEPDHGLFPCFWDDACFRQAMLGRDPQDHSGLVSIQEARSRIVIMSGCCLIALGRSWSNTVHSLAYQCGQSTSLSVVATASVNTAMLELDFLCLALIAQGLPLGDVVHEINQVSDVYRQATGLPSGVGPFVLIGNPCLRVQNFGLQEVEAAWDNACTFHIDLKSGTIDKERGALVCVRMPPRPQRPHVIMRHIPPDVWCRGIWHRWGEECALYLWIGASAPKEMRDNDVVIECHETNPWVSACSAVARFVSKLPFWGMFLDSYRLAFREEGLPADTIEQTLAALPGALRFLSRGVLMMQSQPGVLVPLTPKLQTLYSVVWKQMGHLAGELLNCVIDIACSLDPPYSYGRELFFRRAKAVGPLGTCVCGEGILWGQRYKGGDGRQVGQVDYYCSLCGPVGRDDGRRLVRLTSLPKRVRQGAEMECRCECQAPEGEFVQVHLVAGLKNWLKDRWTVGKVVTTQVMAGKKVHVVLSITVPGDFQPGVYRMAVWGIVNGALYLVRQVVEVIG